ncbi:MAG TPA: 30S ribosomal protein S9 [Nitrospiria bacterium]|jgi:small subunit ribosomal protein S9|nr:30S ribosomal protein S9 [Nitrospiria bacterium]
MSTAGLIAATGKRKNAVARVQLKPGTGQILINDRTLENYFPREIHRIQILQPFQVTSTTGKFNAAVNVQGGGEMGQAGAVRHGIAKALLQTNAALREPLKKEGLLTRDSRVKERKKYGQKGARRRFQYSKR